MPATQIRDMGPCCITWDAIGVNLEMRPVLGSVTFRAETQSEDIFENQHGLAPVDAMFTGRVATLEVPMTRSNLAQLNVIIHDSVKRKTGGKYKILDVPNPVGDNMFPIAKEIILKPVIDRVCSIVTSEWVHIHRCYPIDAIELVWDNSTQRIYNVVFKCFPDDASGQVGDIYRLGPAS